MILTVSTTHRPATDLGYLLHKHPGRAQSFEVSIGTAHVFYPEADRRRLHGGADARGRPGRAGARAQRDCRRGVRARAVRERPAVRRVQPARLSRCSRVFRTAMAGRCDARPGAGRRGHPAASIHVPALPLSRRSGPGEAALRAARLAGRRRRRCRWTRRVPDWGDSPLRRPAARRARSGSRDALHHLYVLLPVLDDAKHYWVSPDEVDKLIRAGDGLARRAPRAELITRRYLAHRAGLDAVVARPAGRGRRHRPGRIDNADDAPRVGDEPDRPVPLQSQLRGAVLAALPPRRPRSESATWAAARVRCCADCWPTRRSPGSSAPTCRRGRSSSRPARLRLDRMPEPQAGAARAVPVAR